MSRIDVNRLIRLEDRTDKQTDYFLAMINNSICELTDEIKEVREIIEQDQNPINPKSY